jgi:hypothetical protein
MLCCASFTVWCPGGHVQHGADSTIYLARPSLSRKHCIVDDILVRLCGNCGGSKIPAKYQDPLRSHGPTHWWPIHHLVRTRKDLVWADLKLFPAAKSVEVTHITPAPDDDPHDHRCDERQFDDPDYFHLSGNARFVTNIQALKLFLAKIDVCYHASTSRNAVIPGPL